VPNQSMKLLFNNTGVHALSFDSQFEIFSYFVLGKYSVNRPHANKSVEKYASESAEENK